jgi:hypothetical protein
VGTLTYGPTSLRADFDDRVLAHLRAVMVAKLKRAECFLFTWTDDSAPTPTEKSLWIHPAVGMQFEFSAGAAQSLNREWLIVLDRSANSTFGLTLRPEPEPVADPPLKRAATQKVGAEAGAARG